MWITVVFACKKEGVFLITNLLPVLNRSYSFIFRLTHTYLRYSGKFFTNKGFNPQSTFLLLDAHFTRFEAVGNHAFSCGKHENLNLPIGITFFIPQTHTPNSNKVSFLKNLKVINRCVDYWITLWFNRLKRGKY
jgi:hypothetical protein